MHFLLAGKELLSLETQTEMSMEYDSTECEFWCQIAKVRSTKQFVGLMRANNETRIRGKMSVAVLAQSNGHFCANM